MESGRRLSASPAKGRVVRTATRVHRAGASAPAPAPARQGRAHRGIRAAEQGPCSDAAPRSDPRAHPRDLIAMSARNSVAPAGRVELPTSRSVAERSVQLSYAGAEILVPTCQGRCLAASGYLRRSAPNRNFRGPDPVPNVPGRSGTLVAIRFSSPDRGRRAPLWGCSGRPRWSRTTDLSLIRRTLYP